MHGAQCVCVCVRERERERKYYCALNEMRHDRQCDAISDVQGRGVIAENF